MADDLKKQGEPDRSRINLNEAHEVSYWTKTLGVDERTLRSLVARHGTSVDKVREAIRAGT